MRKLPKIISQEEFEKLFSESKKKEASLKSKPMKKKMREVRLSMLLGFESGLRISEIVGYKDKVPKLTKDKIRDSDIIVTSGKGGKDRIVPRPRRLKKSEIDMLPLSITRRTLQKKVEELGLQVLDRKISFHTFRHGFGSHLAGKNRPLHEIQMMLGHSRLDTTGIYLHANPKNAIEGALEVF